MATSLNNVVSPRDSGYQGVGVLRRSFTFSDFPTGALEKVVGGLPAGAQIVGGGVVITTAQATATIGIGYRDYDGTTTSAAAYGSAMVLTPASGLVALDELAAATNLRRSVPTQVIVTASAALTTGVFDVIILYVTLNPTSGAIA